MGFKLPQRTARLIFEGEYEGAEVRMKLDVAMGVFMEATRLQAAGDIEGLCRFVAALLIEWNVEDEGGPLPADFDGLMRCTPAFVNLVIEQWVKALTDVPAPLGAPSVNGGAPPMEIPMVPA